MDDSNLMAAITYPQVNTLDWRFNEEVGPYANLPHFNKKEGHKYFCPRLSTTHQYSKESKTGKVVTLKKTKE